ncbi:MAG: galactokinase [Gemmatimonadales bacterium]|nr:galactokinase [Gemmatimonadales bacterium]
MTHISSTRLAADLHRHTFGSDPTTGASAPGRVNLIGEHTDYNGGPVLPVALQRRTGVVVGPGDGWSLVSSVDNSRVTVDVHAPLRLEWSDYIVGVIRELEAIGAAPAGATVAIASTVPIGAGLSSSAAITVGAAKALSLLAGRRLTPVQLVDIAARAEHEQVGVRGGRMDQTISVHACVGTALLFETGTGTMRTVPMPGRIWIIETGISHKLTGGELNARRAECEAALETLQSRWPGLAHLADLPLSDLDTALAMLPVHLARRTRHIVTETARVFAAVDALSSGNLAELGRLLVTGHESLRVDYESSCAEADTIVEAALAHGAFGARLTGAGWGGAVLMLAAPERETAVVEGIRADFKAAYGRCPLSWSTEAGGGVRRETVRE